MPVAGVLFMPILVLSLITLVRSRIVPKMGEQVLRCLLLIVAPPSVSGPLPRWLTSGFSSLLPIASPWRPCCVPVPPSLHLRRQATAPCPLSTCYAGPLCTYYLMARCPCFPLRCVSSGTPPPRRPSCSPLWLRDSFVLNAVGANIGVLLVTLLLCAVAFRYVELGFGSLFRCGPGCDSAARFQVATASGMLFSQARPQCPLTPSRPEVEAPSRHGRVSSP